MQHGSDWELTNPTVLRHRAAPHTPAQRVAGYVMTVAEEAILSHESAGAWWGLRGCRLEDPVQVTTAIRRHRHLDGLELRTVRSLDERWVTRHDGVRVARPELVAMQLMGTMQYERAERFVDQLWSMKLLSGRSLAMMLADLSASGRNGIANLRRFYLARGDGYTPPDSMLEARVERILARAGIAVRRQVDLGDGHWSARVDFLHEHLPVVVEVQSELHHSSLTDTEHDRRRLAQLEADGFAGVAVTDREVWANPLSVVSRVRKGIRIAQAGFVGAESPVA